MPPLHTCECVAGQTIEGKLTSIYCALVQLISNGNNPVGASPPGTILPYGGATAPEGGWLLARGQSVSRTTYADLFAVYGTTYGAGDGVTTFDLPDLRNRTIFGVGAGTDRLNIGGDNPGAFPSALLGAAGGNYALSGVSTSGGTGGGDFTAITQNGSTQGVVPPAILLNYIIKT